ncbi:MAG: hypothetical protein HYU41_26870 [Candidatus Rokubacteria bacterium]|nr:hypothetical protein [Candidatus Rokubacteria bacterium]
MTASAVSVTSSVNAPVASAVVRTPVVASSTNRSRRASACVVPVTVSVGWFVTSGTVSAGAGGARNRSSAPARPSARYSAPSGPSARPCGSVKLAPKSVSRASGCTLPIARFVRLSSTSSSFDDTYTACSTSAASPIGCFTPVPTHVAGVPSEPSAVTG